MSLNTGVRRTARLVLRSTDAGGAPISHTIEVVQAAGAGVIERSLVVTPDETIIAHQLATFNDEIRVVSNVPWRASKDVGWITSIRPNSGNAGTTSVTINWNDNQTASERTGKITFTSNEPGVTEVVTDVVNVSQRAGTPAPFLTVNGEENLSQVQRPSGMGTYTFTVESNRNWRSQKVTRDADWVQLSVQSGSGNTTVVATYQPNTGANKRTVTWRYTIDGVSGIRPQLRLEQAAPGVVVLTIAPEEGHVFEYVGGEVEREVASNVSWQLVNPAAGSNIPDWLTVSPRTGSNNQTITITCAPNTQSSERMVSIRLQSREIDPQINIPAMVFRQEGRPAAALGGPADAIILSPIAGMQTFNITANTPWRITKNMAATWITSISPSTGSDDQRIEITFIANPETTERETTMTLSSTTAGVDLSEDVVIKQSGAAASFLTGPTTISIPSAGGRKAFNISSNVDWEILGGPSWITSFRPQRGNGDATVEFAYQANPQEVERVGMFRIQEVTSSSSPVTPAMIEVKQAPRVVVNQRSLSVNPRQNTFPPIMGSVNLTVSSTIPWETTGVPAWVMLSQTSGTADATVELTYQANAATTQRDAMIMFRSTDMGTIIIRSVNISQEGSTVRTLSVSETQVNLPSTLGSRQLVVSSNIPWVMEETIAWITLDKNAGTTSETVTVSYEANSASTPRSGIIMLRNNDGAAVITHTINISQVGVPQRALVVTPTPLNLPPTIGSTMLTVTSTNVDWIIEEDIAWVTPDQLTGTASATVVLTYEANPTANARDGTITFRSNTGSPPITVVIDISQGGRASRVLSINTNSVDLPSTMGSRLLTVSTNIAWVIEENVAWVTPDQTSGTADATVRLTYDANVGASVRMGTITFKSNDSGTLITRSVSVTQAGSPTAPPSPPSPPAPVRTLSVSDTQLNLLSTLGSTQLTVSSNIPWVMEEAISWITLDINAGTTTATVTVSYEANIASGERSGAITLRNNDGAAVIMHTINISQAGVPQRALGVTPTPLNLPPTVGSTMLTVTSTNVPWTATGEPSWVTLDQASGTASATVTISYEANPTANARVGIITFRSSDSGSPISVVIDISQGGRTSRVLSINTNKVDFPSTMGSRQLTVNTNIAWLIEEDIAWITTSPSMGEEASTVRISYDANGDATVRMGVLMFKSNDNGTLITRRVSVTQAGSPTVPPPPPPPPPVVLGLPILDEGDIHIFPNPAGNWVHIEGIKGNGHVLTIRSLAGILLRSEALRVDARGASAIDISRFPRGVYIFTIRGPQGIIIRRLIKE